ncbi:Resolvase domain-containing protein [Halorubrum kocurii JCM 14978]|uniref:Resolvase domain-containing protein n=2 Tax=Halorubrum kocurii TaxID=478441 RepID=M0NIH5_9EURY|nr:Resolvase domain-containing protein [Halorubrum kocurii JCM 14978]
MSLERQQRDVEDYAEAAEMQLVEVYNEGRRSSGFDEDRPEYQAMLDSVDGGDVDAVVVPNFSRLSRDRKHRLQLLLDREDVELHSVELGRAVDLNDDWELVQQSIRATTDDVEKRKEIERSKRATSERIENGYDHGRPPYGLEFDDDGEYWVPGEDFEDVLGVIRLRNQGHTYAEISEEVGIPTSTAARIGSRKEFYFERQDLVDE